MKSICFLAHEMDEVLERQIMQLDTPENEVHLVTNILEDNFCPPIILSFLEENGWKEEDTFHFYSDIPTLCEIVRTVYGRIFEKIECFETTEIWEYPLDELYEIVLQFPKCKVEKGQCVYFLVQGTYFVWEPMIGEPVIITETGIIYKKPQKVDICYLYPYFEEAIQKISVGRNVLSEKEYLETANYFMVPFLHEMEEKKETQPLAFGMFLVALENMVSHQIIEKKEELFYVLLCISFLIRVTKLGKYVDFFNEILYVNKDRLSCNQKYYLWRQQKRYFFHMKALKTKNTYAEKLYEDIYREYKEKCKEYLDQIPKEKRNPKKIIVLTIQFLKEVHAPTRTTLERCATLQKELGKDVLIINTIEQLTTLGEVPLYMPQEGAVLKEYDDRKEYTYRETTFGYKQCKKKMPNIEEVKEILELIRCEKPYLIITMGGGSIVSDLAANIVPIINIPLVFSTIIKRDNQFTSLGRKLTQIEWEEIEKAGVKKETIIEGTFTFDIKEQKEHFTRETFMLPNGKFLLLVVGLRLHFDVDDEFIEAMSHLYENDIHLVFAGYFDNYQEMCEKHIGLREHSTFIGLQSDMLAVNEIIDLYVNPKRVGGGFSIAEAFSKGKPGITINYGDVGATAGEDFRVDDYEKMVEEIKRYREDEDYYNQKSTKALERIKELTDSKAALSHILKEAEKRKIFF